MALEAILADVALSDLFASDTPTEAEAHAYRAGYRDGRVMMFFKAVPMGFLLACSLVILMLLATIHSSDRGKR